MLRPVKKGVREMRDEGGMLQCTGDKAGMQTPGTEPWWAHGAAPFEINGK